MMISLIAMIQTMLLDTSVSTQTLYTFAPIIVVLIFITAASGVVKGDSLLTKFGVGALLGLTGGAGRGGGTGKGFKAASGKGYVKSSPFSGARYKVSDRAATYFSKKIGKRIQTGKLIRNRTQGILAAQARQGSFHRPTKAEAEAAGEQAKDEIRIMGARSAVAGTGVFAGVRGYFLDKSMSRRRTTKLNLDERDRIASDAKLQATQDGSLRSRIRQGWHETLRDAQGGRVGFMYLPKGTKQKAEIAEKVEEGRVSTASINRSAAQLATQLTQAGVSASRHAIVKQARDIAREQVLVEEAARRSNPPATGITTDPKKIAARQEIVGVIDHLRGLNEQDWEAARTRTLGLRMAPGLSKRRISLEHYKTQIERKWRDEDENE